MASVACTPALSSVRLSMPPRSLLQVRSPSASFVSVNANFSSSRLTDTRKFPSIRRKANSSSEDPSSSDESNELLADLKQKWDSLENKSTVLLYGGGAIVAVWLSSIVVSAINSVPVLPKILELVGLGYSSWFVYRYLLFKQSRKELVSEIESLKEKITGSE